MAQGFISKAFPSFQPPPLPDPGATRPTGPPDWVLLDTMAYITDHKNGTTATAFASNGLAVEVTFWVADPPALSYFCVHCGDLKETDFAEQPRVICSDKYIAVLCLHFAFDTRYPGKTVFHRDFFVYTASPKNPSLVRLPSPFPRNIYSHEVGLLRTDGEEGYVIAVLRPELSIPCGYNLYIFLSKEWRWTTKLVELGSQESLGTKAKCLACKTDKVIAFQEEGSLGWVDLSRGILLCKVLGENPDPVVRFIPLPKPMDSNMDIENYAYVYRDVTYINGLIKFVEIGKEKIMADAERTTDPSDIADMQYDEDLELYNNMCIKDSKDIFICDGWRAVAWVKNASWSVWIKDCEASVHDITVNNPRHSYLLEMSNSSSGKLKLKNLITAAPTLRMHGDDIVVYLMCKENIDEENAWVLAINMTQKTLEDLALFSAERFFSFNITYRPCAFSKYLDMAADNREVAFQVKEREDSKYDSEGTTILVHRLDPCVTESQLRHILNQFGELRNLQIFEYECCASVKFSSRRCAENAISALNGARIGRMDVCLSWGLNTPDGLPPRKKVRLSTESFGQSISNPAAQGPIMYADSMLARYGYDVQHLKVLLLPLE